jgi:hypothetical protein
VLDYLVGMDDIEGAVRKGQRTVQVRAHDMHAETGCANRTFVRDFDPVDDARPRRAGDRARNLAVVTPEVAEAAAAR